MHSFVIAPIYFTTLHLSQTFLMCLRSLLPFLTPIKMREVALEDYHKVLVPNFPGFLSGGTVMVSAQVAAKHCVVTCSTPPVQT